ncbi:transposase (plasmid) [Streptomyces sp. NBC_00715]
MAYPLAGSTGTGDLVIADRGFWSVEFVHAFTTSGADLLVRLESNHLGTTQADLPDGSRLSLMRPGKDVRLRAAREGRVLPKETIYRVITFTRDDRVVHLGTSLLDPEQHPADELIALYRQRWEIELAFDEIKNHLGPGGPLRSRTPEAVRQELWAMLAVHQAVRLFAHAAAASGPVVDADRLSYLHCVRIARRSVSSQHGVSRRKLTSAWRDATQEARSRLLPPRSRRDRPRAIKKPMRWPILRTRSGRSKVEAGRWAHNQTSKVKKHRGAGRPVPRQASSSAEFRSVTGTRHMPGHQQGPPHACSTPCSVNPRQPAQFVRSHRAHNSVYPSGERLGLSAPGGWRHFHVRGDGDQSRQVMPSHRAESLI